MGLDITSNKAPYKIVFTLGSVQAGLPPAALSWEQSVMLTSAYADDFRAALGRAGVILPLVYRIVYAVRGTTALTVDSTFLHRE